MILSYFDFNYDLKQTPKELKHGSKVCSPNTRCRKTAILTVDTTTQNDFHRPQNFDNRCQTRFFFGLNLELLFAVICLIWLADHLLMKALSLNFCLSDFTAHKTALSSKMRKQKNYLFLCRATPKCIYQSRVDWLKFEDLSNRVVSLLITIIIFFLFFFFFFKGKIY